LTLARLALAEGGSAAAFEYVEQAISSDLNNLQAQIFKGVLLRRQGSLEEALAIFSAVLERDPYLVEARWVKAGAHMQLNQRDAARKELNAVDNIKPGLLRSRYLRALLAHQDGDNDSAQSMLGKIRQAFPQHLPSLRLLGIVSYAQGRYEIAETYLAQFIAVVPADITIRKYLAELKLKQNAADKAIEVLEPLAEAGHEGSSVSGYAGYGLPEGR